MNTTDITSWLKHNHNIDVISIYPYGSRVYGTNSTHSHSDYDFIAITDADMQVTGYSDNIPTAFDVTVYNKSDFQQRINNHEISALECLWLGGDSLFTFELNKEKLRESISAKVSHCWVKGKKKLTVGSDIPKASDTYIGIKSVFHAFRICAYGIQIAKYGKIVDYAEVNHIWNELTDTNWDSIYAKYKSQINNYLTEFRKLCPKLM